MSLDILVYLAAGAVAGLIAGLFGVGGGLIVVPVLVSVFSWHEFASQHLMQLALGTSLATIIATSSSSILAHYRRGSVRWDLFWRLVPGIACGAWLGAGLAKLLPSQNLQWLFGIAECGLGAYMWFKPAAVEHAAPAKPWPIWQGPLAGSFIGSISALAGIGGGTVTVPYLSRTGVRMTQAVGTSAACGLPIALVGCLSYIIWGWHQPALPAWSSGYVYWPAALAIASMSFLLAPAGARLAHRLPDAVLKKAFAGLLLLLGLKMLWSAWF